MACGAHDHPPEVLESCFGFSAGADHVSFDVDETVYPLDATYGWMADNPFALK